MLIAVFGSIVAILGIILLHECGHYIMARWMGVKVLKFSIGFGKVIWQFVGKNGTKYALSLLPLGGYVKMLGEGDELVSSKEKGQAYNQKPLVARMLIVLAGPMANFIIALVAYWGVYLMGVTHIKPIIGKVVPGSIAAKATLKPGDLIIKVGKKNINDWTEFTMALVMEMGNRKSLTLTVKPNNHADFVVRHLLLKNWDLNQRQPDFFKSLGFSPDLPELPAVIGKILPKSAAEKSGLKVGDRIESVNNHKINNWASLSENIVNATGQTLRLTVQSGEQVREVIIPIKQLKQKEPDQAVHVNAPTGNHLGIMPIQVKWPAQLVNHKDYTVWTAWKPAAEKSWTLFVFNVHVLIKMLQGQISIKTLGGPITLFEAAGQASQAGWQVYLGFIGFVSLMIGFLNLLPIPGLDGGHFFFQVLEAILRRPVPERIQFFGIVIGLSLLFVLMVHATINDIIRLFYVQ